MWLIFARAPPSDVHVWPGRRALALVDAIAWPCAWAALVLELPAAAGVVGQAAVAYCVFAMLQRAHRAIALNHRYHFTTWQWGRCLALVLLFGYALKLAAVLPAWRSV